MRRLIPFIAVLMLVTAACGDGGSNEVAVVFDGTGCSYDGSTEFATGTKVMFTFTNESDTTEVFFGIWRLPEGATEADIQSTGLDRLTGGDTLISRSPGPIGEPWFDSATFATAGQFAAGCVDFSEAPSDAGPMGPEPDEIKQYVTMITVEG